MANTQPLSCPFCTFEDDDADFLLQHVNLVHPEIDDVPNAVQHGQERPDPAPAEERALDWIECPCGEFFLLAEFQDHLDLHDAEEFNFDDIDYEGTDMTTLIPVRGGRASFPDTPSTADVSLQRNPYSNSIPFPRDTSQDQQVAYSGSHKDSNLSQTCSMEVMRLSTVEPTKSIATSKLKSKSARLGVCGLLLLLNQCD